MEFEKIIDIRQSTRKFGEKIPCDKTIEKILAAGQKAPTAKNVQPVKIYVCKSKNALSAVDASSPCRYGAPVVLAVCSDTETATNLSGHSTAEIDGSIVATFLMLAATNDGVDSIWIEHFDRDILRKELGIPENLYPVCLIPLGYRAQDCPVSRNFHNRKPLNDIVLYT